MKYKISHTVMGVEFSAKADTIARAYAHVRALIINDRIAFPDQDETLSEYMEILVDMKNGKLLSHENHIFRVEVIAD